MLDHPEIVASERFHRTVLRTLGVAASHAPGARLVGERERSAA